MSALAAPDRECLARLLGLLGHDFAAARMSTTRNRLMLIPIPRAVRANIVEMLAALDGSGGRHVGLLICSGIITEQEGRELLLDSIVHSTMPHGWS